MTLSDELAPDSAAERPDESWTIERLLDYSVASIDAAWALARKTAVQVWLAGQALSLAREKCAHGEWGSQLKSRGIPRSTANEAIRLYRSFLSPQKLESLTLAEALKQCGVRKPRKTAVATVPDERNATDDEPAPEGSDQDEHDGPENLQNNPVNVADGGETGDDEVHHDADDEWADDGDEVEDEACKSEGDGEWDQEHVHSPVAEMDAVLARLAAVECTIQGTHLDEDSTDEFLLKLREAQHRLGRIQEAVELQTED